jgi:hypothetical protein
MDDRGFANTKNLLTGASGEKSPRSQKCESKPRSKVFLFPSAGGTADRVQRTYVKERHPLGFPMPSAAFLENLGLPITMDESKVSSSVMEEAKLKVESYLRKYKIDAISCNLIRIEELHKRIESLKKENVEIEAATVIPEGTRFRD